LVDNVGGRINDWLTAFDGAAQDAIFFADAGPEDLGAVGAYGLLARDAGEAFRSAIEAGEAPIAVHRENALIEGVQDSEFQGIEVAWG
jgi:hypothetical protein